MESLAGLSAADLGATGLLALAVLLIMFGRLIPRGFHRAMVEDKDRQLAEKDRRIDALEALASESAQQVSTLIPKIELSLHIAEVIKRLGEEAGK